MTEANKPAMPLVFGSTEGLGVTDDCTTAAKNAGGEFNAERALIDWKLRPPQLEADTEDGGAGAGERLLVTHAAPVGLGVSLFGGVREVAELVLQQLALRLKFSYLLLERRILRLKLENLGERYRKLELRLLELRRWHVQYPPVDETSVSGVEHEPRAGAEFEPREAGRLIGGEGASDGSVTPNV